MEFSWDCHYGVTKRLASLVGQWPYQNKRERILRMGVTITAALILNIPQIKTFTDRVFPDWERLQSSQEYEIMKTYVANAKWNICMYFAIAVMGTSTFVFVSLIPHILDVVLPLNESRPIILPYEAYYFVDERKYFVYIFLQGGIALHIILMALVAYDTMFMTFVEHICSIFAVAGFRCEHLVNKDVDIVKIVNNDLGDMHNKRMARCVKVHWAALEFAEHLEDTFSLDFGIELVLATIAMSITLYQVTLQSDDSLEAMRYVIYVIAQMVHLFIFCWEGQRLIDHSLLIHDKITVSKDMEFSWDRHYGVTKRLATFVGQWPYQNKRERILRMGVTITAALVMNIPQIKTLTNRVFIDWGRLQSLQEYEIMKTYVANTRWTVCIYFAICLIGCAIFVFMSLVPHILDVVLPLNESRPIILPYEAYYFIDERKYFFYIFLQGGIAIHIVLMALVAYDTMFMTFVEHICSIFAVAGFRCEHLVNKDVDIVKIVNNDLGDMHNKRMARCVNVHWAALE
ncbi:uncharacterized protein LOC116841413 [Odontomachus brunneus]|uniref:uncharacterized protein LOC116841413 n=1 Tax=Odontomachus brunneus TaxID=486640 RepID=UPI0013F2051E|nr:uncharacterized protein LOC116841413 [Odontomachus brunneus]